jgi:regulator of protease activity HflC (stomatin/prohibitin superfamily)
MYTYLSLVYILRHFSAKRNRSLTPLHTHNSTYLYPHPVMNKKTIIGIFSTAACLILLLCIPWLLLWILEGKIMNSTGWSPKDLTLIRVLLQVIIILLVWLAIPYFFKKIPENNFVCVEIFGKLVHFLGHKGDVEKLRKYMRENPGLYTSSPFSADQLVAREDHWLFGWLVTIFNYHVISLNPFASLRKIKVTRRRINPDATSGNSLDTMIVPSTGSTGEESTPYLLFEFPRPALAKSVESQNQVLFNIVLLVTRLRLTDLYQVFYGHHNDVSAWIDLQLISALIRFCGELNADEFGGSDFTSDPNNKFNRFMREDASGLRRIGIDIVGNCSIAAYELADSEQALRKALRQEEIAQVEIRTARSEAEAAAVGTIKAGEAEANAIKAKGQAKADALRAELEAKMDGAKKLKEALGAPELAAGVLQNEALAGGSIHTFVSGGSAATPSIMIGGTGNGQSSVPPPTNMMSGNAGISTKPTPAGKAPTNDTSTSGDTTGNDGNVPPGNTPDNDGDDDTPDDTSND